MEEVSVFVWREMFYKYLGHVFFGVVVGILSFGLSLYYCGIIFTVAIYFGSFVTVGLMGAIVNRQTWTEVEKKGLKIISFALGLYLTPHIFLLAQVIVGLYFLLNI